MSYNRVVVIGGGPIGLMCAIEAKRQDFREVYLIEKRPEYTRLNVPQLGKDVRKHLKKVIPEVRLDKTRMGGVSFRELEPPLLARAQSMGVQLLRPCVVSSIAGISIVLHGRVNEMMLVINNWDHQNKRVDFSAPTKPIFADLLILTTGAGAAEDKMVTGTLGFSYERLKPVNYMALGIFDRGQEPENDPAFYDIQGAADKFAGGICFPCGDYDYLLYNLSGITTGDYQRRVLSKSLVVVGPMAIQTSCRSGLRPNAR
jgi:flavin-dependent dehydrogenase